MPHFRSYIYSNDGGTIYATLISDGISGAGVLTDYGVDASSGQIDQWNVSNGATIVGNKLILPIKIQGLATTENSQSIDLSIGEEISANTYYYCVEASTPQPTFTFKHFFDAGTIGSGTVKFRHYSQQAQLATPQNVAASGTTVSWGAVENATSYEILVSGSSFGTVSTTSEDLSTLSRWASLTDGTYNITIVAKADGYRDSEPSAAVSVTKTSGFTLQLNVYHLGRQAFVKKDGTATPTDYDYYYRYGDEGIKTISGINAYITVLNERGDGVYFYDKVNCSSSGDGSSLATLTLNSDASARLELSD